MDFTEAKLGDNKLVKIKLSFILTNKISGNFHLKRFCHIYWRHSLILVNAWFENTLLVQTAQNTPQPHYLLKLTKNLQIREVSTILSEAGQKSIKLKC